MKFASSTFLDASRSMYLTQPHSRFRNWSNTEAYETTFTDAARFFPMKILCATDNLVQWKSKYSTLTEDGNLLLLYNLSLLV
jgi:hypothetical protein